MERISSTKEAGKRVGLMAAVILNTQMDLRIVVYSVTALNMGLGLSFHRLVLNTVVIGKEVGKLEMPASVTKMVMFIKVRFSMDIELGKGSYSV